MTDREVQKLGRRELLEFLLEAQEENEALQQECDDLHDHIASLEKTLEEIRAAKAQADAELERAVKEASSLREQLNRGSTDEVNERAAMLLAEARATAEDVVESRRVQHSAIEMRLQEWERRLQDRDELLSEKERRAREDRISQEAQIQRVLSDARREATQTLQSAEAEAARTLKRAAEQASQIELKAEQDAEQLLQHAQEDSNSFWQDVTELLQKRILGQNSD